MEGAGGRRGFVPCRFAQQQLEGPGDGKRTCSLQVFLFCRLCRSLTPGWGKDEARGCYVTALASEVRLPFWGQTPGLMEPSPSLRVSAANTPAPGPQPSRDSGTPGNPPHTLPSHQWDSNGDGTGQYHSLEQQAGLVAGLWPACPHAATSPSCINAP